MQGCLQLPATSTHYDHGAQPRSKVFDFSPEETGIGWKTLMAQQRTNAQLNSQWPWCKGKIVKVWDHLGSHFIGHGLLDLNITIWVTGALQCRSLSRDTLCGVNHKNSSEDCRSIWEGWVVLLYPCIREKWTSGLKDLGTFSKCPQIYIKLTGFEDNDSEQLPVEYYWLRLCSVWEMSETSHKIILVSWYQNDFSM